MMIVQWPCVCPACREVFTAFVLDTAPPPPDELAADRKSMLCNTCERRFVNQLYREHAIMGGVDRGMANGGVRLSEVPAEASGGGEPLAVAAHGTRDASGVHGGLPVVRDVLLAGRCPEGVHGRPEAPREALRGQTALPAE